jgi:hypothetical protein
LPRRRLLAAKCSNSTTLPGRVGGESWGLATVKRNVILLHYDTPSPCGRSPSIACPFAVAAAAFRTKRLALAGALIALIWFAVFWAMS